MGRAVDSRRSDRGFTLIELLVAIIAGLLVAAAAISFSKQSTRFFAQEARVASAQMSVLAGFQRLNLDLSRASFMSTPNMRRDQNLNRILVSNTIYTTWPADLQQLTGLMITEGGSNTAPAMPDGSQPDSVRISGSLETVEQFSVRAIAPNGVGHTVYLDPTSPALSRTPLQPGGDMSGVFRPGRILRVREGTKAGYAIIAAASWPVGNAPQIATSNPYLVNAEATEGTGRTEHQGITNANGVGTVANVVNVVEYAVASVSDHPVYSKTIYSTAATAIGDETRTELIRREVLITGTDPGPIHQDDSAEIVAEYAVDLRFGLWTTDGTTGLVFVPPSTGQVNAAMALAPSYNEADPPSGPGTVRSVQVRLVVRSREFDRSQPTDPADPALAGGYVFRYPMPGDATGTRFARARTLVAEIALQNQRDEADR